METSRRAEHTINPLILNRWSPRAMSGEEISDTELMPLFEAARWAPSSYNEQPWKILYAKKGSSEWNLFYSLLTEFNQTWCKNAACLCTFISCNHFKKNQKLSRTHSFDTGAAWMALALEGASQGLVVHGMSGFDYGMAKENLEIPDGYTVEAMCAIGKPGPKENLPEEIASKESPSDRKPLCEVIQSGRYG